MEENILSHHISGQNLMTTKYSGYCLTSVSLFHFSDNKVIFRCLIS